MKNNAVVVFAGFLLLFAFSGFLIYRDGLIRQPVPSTQISTSVESIKIWATARHEGRAERDRDGRAPYNKIPAQPLPDPEEDRHHF